MTQEVNVFLLPCSFEPERLGGGIAVVIDVLRASTTIVTALANGASCVIPCGDIATAKRIAAELPRGEVLLGGERSGVGIDGFDLDNSPARYTRERVGGKTIVLTTTNGTAALFRSRSAARVLIGSFVNRRAVVQELRRDHRPVHLVCAGTDGRVTAEDLLGAGAIAADLLVRSGEHAASGKPTSATSASSVELPACDPESIAIYRSRDDLTAIARDLWTAESASQERLQCALRQSLGGRNLVDLGFDADISAAAQVDSIDLVAEYFPQTGRIEAVRPRKVPVGYERK